MISARPARFALWIAFAFIASLLVPTPALAQAIYGTVTGVVADASAAAIPGASITLTNQNTGLALETQIRRSRAPIPCRNVTAGTYTLKASITGFREFTQTGIPRDARRHRPHQPRVSKSADSPMRSR